MNSLPGAQSVAGCCKSGARFPQQQHAGGNLPAYPMPALPSEDKRWKIVNGTMRRHGYARNALIETLHTAQSSFGFLDDTAIRFVAQSLHVPLSQAYGGQAHLHRMPGHRMLHQRRRQAGG